MSKGKFLNQKLGKSNSRRARLTKAALSAKQQTEARSKTAGTKRRKKP